MTPTRHSGKLITWKDDRGFGFIQPDDGGKDVFLHISELKNATRRPRENDTIRYYFTVSAAGKLRAVNAVIVGAGLRESAPETVRGRRTLGTASRSRWPIAELLLLAILPLVGATHFTWLTGNPWPLILYPLMSVITYALYADDKARAKQRVWRTAEGTLHGCELIGGWPGGLVAQQVLRHKSQKKSYQVQFWAIVAIHELGWLLWLLWG